MEWLIDKNIQKVLLNSSDDATNLIEYLRIINKALSEKRKKVKMNDLNYVWYEEHHILPKSLFPEYKKIKENKVLLLPEEHFIAHKLLVSIFPGKEMAHAFWRMTCCTREKRIVSPEDYALARKLARQYPIIPPEPSQEEKETRSKRMKELWADGKITATKEKHAKSVATRKANGSYQQTDEQKLAKSKKLRGRIFINNGINNKFIWPDELDSYLADGWKRGKKPLSEEHKQNIKKNHKTRKEK